MVQVDYDLSELPLQLAALQLTLLDLSADRNLVCRVAMAGAAKTLPLRTSCRMVNLISMWTITPHSLE